MITWHTIKKLPSLFLVLLLRVYQWTLSPFLGSNCRFTPTCSQYAIDALKTHGLLKGTALTMKRIGHCQPWSRKNPMDPVPCNRKDI